MLKKLPNINVTSFTGNCYQLLGDKTQLIPVTRDHGLPRGNLYEHFNIANVGVDIGIGMLRFPESPR